MENPKKILVVDDERDVLCSTAFRLKQRGHDVLTSCHGEEAFSMAERHLPDLILLDIRLPALGGHEICRLIKSSIKMRHIPVVFLTADASITITDAVATALADGFLLKPFAPEELYQILETHLA